MEVRDLGVQWGVIPPETIRRYHSVDRVPQRSQPAPPRAQDRVPPDAEVPHDNAILPVVLRIYVVIGIKVETNVRHLIGGEYRGKHRLIADAGTLRNVIENIHAL